MSLFIFSSNKTVTAAGIIGILLVIEIALIQIENHLSLDILHLKSIPRISKNLSSPDTTNILFLGNSLTREGINTDIIEDKLLNKRKSAIKIGLAYPDDTSVFEWFYLLKNQFIIKNSKLDYVVISFANDQLEDTHLEFEEIQRVASYIDVKDIPATLLAENLSLDDSFNLIFSKFWKTFAHRQRIQNRILNFLPDYRYTVRRINEGMFTNTSNCVQNKDDRFNYLRRLIELAKENNIYLIFSAVPLPDQYEIDKDTINLVEQNEMTFIDARHLPDMTEKEFLDGYHLNHNGSKIYSNFISSQLLTIIKN